MDPQELVRAPVNKLRKFCCKKCGGVLAQVYGREGKETVICGTHHCEPLEIETLAGRNVRETQSALDYMEVRENYPELCPPVDQEKIRKAKKALFPEE
jgi:hypothetical protein